MISCGADQRTKFSIAVNMERSTPDKEPRQAIRQMRELVQLAEKDGFEIARAAEHHTIELMAGCWHVQSSSLAAKRQSLQNFIVRVPADRAGRRGSS